MARRRASRLARIGSRSAAEGMLEDMTDGCVGLLVTRMEGCIREFDKASR